MGQTGVYLQRHLKMAVALQAAAHDRQVFGIARDVTHGHPGDPRCAHLCDPAAVEQRDRTSGFGVIHDHDAVDIRQSFVVVLLITSHPLQPDAIRAAKVGRHGVDERVLAGGDLRLGWVLHQSPGFLLKGVFQNVDDLGPVEPEALEVGTIQDQHLVLAHRETIRRSVRSPDQGTPDSSSRWASWSLPGVSTSPRAQRSAKRLAPLITSEPRR